MEQRADWISARVALVKDLTRLRDEFNSKMMHVIFEHGPHGGQGFRDRPRQSQGAGRTAVALTASPS
jgi:hypothetical protein